MIAEKKTKDTSYYYLGYGDSICIAIEHIENFDTNEYNLCEIDSNGDIISRIEYSWKDYEYQELHYVGDDIFYKSIGRSFFYDKKNKRMFNIDDILEGSFSRVYALIDIISQNEALFFDNRSSWGVRSGYYFVLDTKILHDTLKIKINDNPGVYLSGTEYGEQLINCAGSNNVTPGVYNYKGELISAYPEKWNIQSVSAFQNGFAVVNLIGADNKEYIVIVDSKGSPQFDPMRSGEEAEQLILQYLRNEQEKYYTRICDKKSSKYTGFIDYDGNELRMVTFISD